VASATNEKLMARMNSESLETMSLFTWLQWIKVQASKERMNQKEIESLHQCKQQQ
jgi:hypothetical protein